MTGIGAPVSVAPPPARVRTVVGLPVDVGGRTVLTEAMTFTGLVDGGDHLLVALGDHARATERGEVLVRVHSECLTGDVFGSQRCDCGPQLRESLERISVPGGYLIYLRQEGRGIGLAEKLRAYELQDAGLDTYEANRALGHGDDERDYAPAAQMLLALGARRIDLLTGNPEKVSQLRGYGIGVRRVQPTGTFRTAANGDYLRAKARRAALAENGLLI